MKVGLKERGADANKAVTSQNETIALQKNLQGCALEQIDTRAESTGFGVAPLHKEEHR
jgi:hypothetical protein